MSGKPSLKTGMAITILLLCIASTVAGKIIYVDDDAPGANDGSSWEDAYNYLQDALADANSAVKPVEIRVAQGTYKPDQGDGITRGDREATFQLVNDVTLKGGYAGLGEPDPNARNFELFETILSGDLAGNDFDVTNPRDLLDEPTRAENSGNVVTGSGTDDTAVLDGFTVTKGYANGYPYYYGGGIYNSSGSPTLTNCTFSRNVASGGGGMFNQGNGNPMVLNCTFSGNWAYNSAGMCNSSSSPTLVKCIFRGNSAKFGGGGIGNYEGVQTLTNCIFNGNSAEYGAGMRNCYSSPILVKCIFRGNSAKFGGGGIGNEGGIQTLTNCIFNGNSAEYGAGMSNRDMCAQNLTNCTFAANSARYGNALACDSWAQLHPCMIEMANCILWNGGSEIWNNDNSAITITYSDVSGGWPGEGNVDGDPMFVDADGADNVPGTEDDNLRLLPASPCIEAGDNLALPPSLLTDLDGNPRIINDTVDMGAYEGPHQGFLLSTSSVTIPEGATAQFSVALAMDPAGTVEVTVTHESGDTDIIVNSPNLLIFDSSNYQQAQVVTLVALQDSDYMYGEALIFISAAGFPTAGVTITELDDEAPEILYVDSRAPASGDGTSWADAFVHLQDALHVADVVPEVKEVRVAQGIYKPDQGDGFTPGDREASFQILNGVAIKGGYAGRGEPEPDARDINLYETILNGDLNENGPKVLNPDQRWLKRGDNSYHVVTSTDAAPTAVLDGFTIAGGNADGSYWDEHNLGAGMFNRYGSPTLLNCTFMYNVAYYDYYSDYCGLGGGMCNHYSSPTVVNCTFSENYSDELGGGMYNLRCSPTLTNCVFSGNWAWIGGGMRNDESSPTLTDCTFSENSVVISGGGMCSRSYSSPTVTNCTFSNNSAYEGAGMCNCKRSSPTVTNCTFSSNSAHEGGGMFNELESIATVTNTIFSNNSADWHGGGMFNEWKSIATVTGSIFSNNSALLGSGAGIYNHCLSSSIITNCTFASNSAGSYGRAISNVGSHAALSNCILWDDTDTGDYEIYLELYTFPAGNYPSTVNVDYSDVKGGAIAVYVGTGCTRDWGQGNINADPCFVQLGYWNVKGLWIDGDYHLLPDSPCIDAGDPNYPYDPNETDLDGMPRKMGSRIDMGAYEFPILCELRINPSTLNLTSNTEWLEAFIWLPEEYNVADIDPDTVLLEGEIQADSLHINEEKQFAIASFNYEEVQAVLDIGEVELTITGQLTDGTPFEATDVIRVLNSADQ